jgi:biopolymer transport protein ExbD
VTHLPRKREAFALRIRRKHKADKIELQMTPMIDIVFMLLIFFVWNFKIVQPEGDFNIRMPSASDEAVALPSETPLARLRLQAGVGGELAGMFLDEAPLLGFDELRARIRQRVGDGAGPGGQVSDQELQIDADYDLRYEYVMDAITAVSGYIDPQSKEPITLVERIQFAPMK